MNDNNYDNSDNTALMTVDDDSYDTNNNNKIIIY